MKRWVVPAVVAFIAIFAADFLIHGVWLSGFYHEHAQWWRPESQMKALMPFMTLAQLILALLLTAVYGKGYESGKGGLGQGVRFGFLMGLLLFAPATLMQYCIYPYPGSLLASWLVGGVAEATLAGAAIGALYKK